MSLFAKFLILYLSFCFTWSAFAYIPHFNQQNAVIKAQQNISQNTINVRYQLLHISAKRCHRQGISNNNKFLRPKRVVVAAAAVVVVVIVLVVTVKVVFVIVLVVVVIVVVIVVVTVEISWF